MSENPIADAREKDMSDEEWLKTLPICHCCKNPIQQTEAVYYNDMWVCEDCESSLWTCIRHDYLVDITDS